MDCKILSDTKSIVIFMSDIDNPQIKNDFTIIIIMNSSKDIMVKSRGAVSEAVAGLR